MEIERPSNILHTSVDVLHSGGHEPSEPQPQEYLLASSADKMIHANYTAPPYKINPLSDILSSDSPTLSWIVIREMFILVTTMSGKIELWNLHTDTRCFTFRHHSKYVVDVAKHEDQNGDDAWIATAGWDGKVFLYRLSMASELTKYSVIDFELVASIELPTNPECIYFIDHPEVSEPVLLLSRRDSTFLYYYAILDDGLAASQTSEQTQPPPMPLLGRQNLAPHSNAWIAFTPSAFAFHPQDPSLLAVATSHVPHMKLIIVRLLLPPLHGNPNANLPSSASVLDPTSGPILNPTQASEARRLLAIQDREGAAIKVQMSTLAPQTAYSTPALAWRPDGSGVWVNGDDGVLRGIETSTGKVVAVLKGGHEAGSKVRCLWAGLVREKQEEIVVSGGFDGKLIVWRCAESDG